MTPEDEKNLNTLGGVLIILSLVLLWCWYGKKKDNMSNRYGDFGLRGFTRSPPLNTAKYLPDMQLEPNVDGMRVKSMHDMSVDLSQMRRHLPIHDDSSKMDQMVDVKWNIDSAVNDPLDRPQQHVVKLPDEIITPAKSQDELLYNRAASVGAAVMSMSDYAPQFGKHAFEPQN